MKSDVELRGGSSSNEGDVIISGRGVCDQQWDIADATVVCTMLGLVQQL